MMLGVLEDEMYLVSSEDQTGSFYSYALPQAWLPCFALGKKRTVAIDGVAADKV